MKSHYLPLFSYHVKEPFDDYKRGLLVLIGESFRSGTQGTRTRGTPESHDAQIEACKSHVKFMEYVQKQHGMNMSVYVATYDTQYTNELLDVYKDRMVGNKVFNHVVGLNNLFQHACSDVTDIHQYSCLLYVRIDLFLKDHFSTVFQPRTKMILFPCICWVLANRHNSYPRINDMMIMVPRKYYSYLPKMNICHELWDILCTSTDLTNDDLDVMIPTYHDSDSYKDHNPMYYIVNRPETTKFHSEGHLFDKNKF